MDGLYGKSYILRWFGGTPIFGNIHMMLWLIWIPSHIELLLLSIPMRSQWPMKAVGLGLVPICPSRIGVVEKTRILHSMMLGLEQAFFWRVVSPQSRGQTGSNFFFEIPRQLGSLFPWMFFSSFNRLPRGWPSFSLGTFPSGIWWCIASCHFGCRWSRLFLEVL